MTLDEIKTLIQSDKYDFLRTDKHLGDKIILLGLGGSYAYGTNVEGSDIDVRGCALNSKEELLSNENFEQFINNETDTTIYSFNKLINLLSNCNPNVIEMFGLKEEHYLYKNKIGQMLLDNKHLFLSKKAVYSFGGYANQQLRRLDNKSQRSLSDNERNQHIANSLNEAKYDICQKYGIDENSIMLMADDEIKINISLKYFSLNKFLGIQNTLSNVLNSYNTLGKRNQKAVDNNKLGKHMMHLIRLYYMCFDILEKQEINTYREKEHDFLMQVRNGLFLTDNQQVIPEFFDKLDELNKRLDYDKQNTDLPDTPNYKKIKELQIAVNEMSLR